MKITTLSAISRLVSHFSKYRVTIINIYKTRWEFFYFKEVTRIKLSYWVDRKLFFFNILQFLSVKSGGHKIYIGRHHIFSDFKYFIEMTKNPKLIFFISKSSSEWNDLIANATQNIFRSKEASKWDYLNEAIENCHLYFHRHKIIQLARPNFSYYDIPEIRG